MLLTDDDIQEIVKPIGARRKLICIRNVLNSVVNECDSHDQLSDKDARACASTLSMESVRGKVSILPSYLL